MGTQGKDRFSATTLNLEEKVRNEIWNNCWRDTVFKKLKQNYNFFFYKQRTHFCRVLNCQLRSEMKLWWWKWQLNFVVENVLNILDPNLHATLKCAFIILLFMNCRIVTFF
jgi:hypothetical protein